MAASTFSYYIAFFIYDIRSEKWYIEITSERMRLERTSSESVRKVRDYVVIVVVVDV